MKRIFVVMICAMLFCPRGYASAFSSLTREELIAEREKIYVDLTSINSLLGSLTKAEALSNDNEGILGKIKNLFPGEALAMCVRDSLLKFSIEQPVTQLELDSITEINPGRFAVVDDLTGIGYLRNLEKLNVGYFSDKYWYYNTITFLPEEITSLTNLKILNIGGYSRDLISIPDNIGNLTNLETLDISDTAISVLPASIGNLINLKKLDISNTRISSLPDSIWNLKLTSLDMAGSLVK